MKEKSFHVTVDRVVRLGICTMKHFTVQDITSVLN